MINQQKMFYKIFKAHIKNSLEIQEIEKQRLAEYLEQTYIPYNWLVNCATISIKSIRRSGHTLSMLRASKKFFNRPLFIFPNQRMAEHAKEIVIKNGKKISLTELDLKTHFRSIHENEDRFRGLNFDAIFVDCATLLSQEEKEKITKIALNSYSVKDRFLLIYVG